MHLRNYRKKSPSNAPPKLLAAFFVFLNISLLTKLPLQEAQAALVAQFLTLNGVVSSVLGFLIFSNYFESAENGTKAHPANPQVLYTTMIAAYITASIALGIPVLYALIFLPILTLYTTSSYFDATILCRDALSEPSNRMERKRVAYRAMVVIASLVTICALALLEPAQDIALSRTTGFCLSLGACTIAIWAWCTKRHPLNLSIYKLSLLAGNIYWNLPRILLQNSDKYQEILQLSFLLAVGQGCVMVANYFYGVLLSTKKEIKLRLGLAILATAIMSIVLLSGFPSLLPLSGSLATVIALLAYAGGGLLQTMARAKCASTRGNRIASTIYLVSLAVALPILFLVVIISPVATHIVAALCFSQLLRSILFEICATSKRYQQ